MEEALELVRLRGRIVGALEEEPRPGRLLVECMVLARDAALARPLVASPVPNVSLELSSDFMLHMVITEFKEIRLLRFMVREMSRSSEWWPLMLNCDCSAGWESAQANASRTGNGVRFRIWMEDICRIRR